MMMASAENSECQIQWIFKPFIHIYLFKAATGSSFLSQAAVSRLCSDFSCCRAWAVGHLGSIVAVSGL